MKKFKRALRVLLWVLFILLAGFGVAITGVAPTFKFSKDRKKEDQTEQVEAGKEEEEEANLKEEVKS